MNSPAHSLLTADLVAVLVAVADGAPLVLVTQGGSLLPSGPFRLSHHSMQAGMRDWVEQQTHHPLGYLEQLYTFADKDRSEIIDSHAISISYLALTQKHAVNQAEASWQSWYDYFPWEDRRTEAPGLDEQIQQALRQWVEQASGKTGHLRADRVAICFGLDGHAWNEDLVLQRYELLYEANLVPEARRRLGGEGVLVPGKDMGHDHRRILATGIARLRAKIKYRALVFELMPAAFTLFQLQKAVEAIAGCSLHKQNFRRLIEQQQLVEETGALSTDGPGRPAKLFRFRPDVLMERAMAGSKLPMARSR